jgi:surface polysaccharide O-acyltransferase-like enzyme
VLVNHTNNLIFWWQATPYSETWFASMFYFFATKVAVPLFLMISGAVLLGKEETYQTVFRKRILRYTVVLIVFSLFYYLVNLTEYAEGGFHLMSFLKRIYTKRITNAYWYMYLYLGILFLLPILRKPVRSMTAKDYIYVGVFHAVIAGTLPLLSHYAGWPEISEHFTAVCLSSYLIYFYTGYFMEHVLNPRYYTVPGALVASLIYLMVTALCTYGMYYEYKATGSISFFLDNVSLITIMVQSLCVFYFIKVWTMHSHLLRSVTATKIVRQIGGCTFGIYLLSDYLIGKLEPVYDTCIQYMNRIPAVMIYEVAVFIVGWCITCMLRSIPYIKKYI